MPSFEFTSPEGKKYTVNGPDGATKEQAFSMLQAQLGQGSPDSVPSVTSSQPKITTGEKILKGVRDPIDGGAQLLTNILPQGLVRAGNRLNNFIADQTGLVGRLPEGGVDQQVREAEQAYQTRRASSGEEGFDGYRTIGNIVSPVNVAAAAKLPQLATLGARIGLSAGAGAATGALNPVGTGDFAEEKAKQVAIGGLAGGAGPLIGNALSRIISPNNTRNANLQLLRSEGVRPTVGQTLGGRFNALEEKATSIPVLGDAISNARLRAVEDFNNAAINRASGKVGVKVTGTGQDAVRQAGDAISDAYKTAINKVPVLQLDNQFNSELAQLTNSASGLTSELGNKFTRTLNEIVMRKVSPNGAIPGDAYKAIDSELGAIVSNYGKSALASEKEFAEAVSGLQVALREQMLRGNPAVAAELRAADSAWANLIRVEAAAKSGKNAEGLFTPAQLNMAVQTADRSTRKRAVSRGTALMQDLGNAGQQVLGNKVPNSFTTDRALIAGAAAGAFSPAAAASVLAGSAAYSKPGQKLLNALVGSRPASAQALGNRLKQFAPNAAPATQAELNSLFRTVQEREKEENDN